MVRGDTLDGALLATIAYFDVFAFAPNVEELHRFVLGHPATRDDVDARLDSSAGLRGVLGSRDGLYFLAGKEHLAERRFRFMEKTKRMWKVAGHMAATIAKSGLATCGMVTGSLAAENVDEGADIDFLFTYPPHRTFSSYAAIRLLAKLPKLGLGDLCPNYALPEDCLEVNPKNLFTAWEIAKAVPLFGFDVYQKFACANEWVRSYLPNALLRFAESKLPPEPRYNPGRRWADAVSKVPGFQKLEALERDRKRRTDTRDVGVDMRLRAAQGSADRHSPSRSFHVLCELRYRMVTLGLEAHRVMPELDHTTGRLAHEMRRWGDRPINGVARQASHSA